MYPNLYYAFKDLFGVDWKFLRVANTFGVFVAISFILAAVVLTAVALPVAAFPAHGCIRRRAPYVIVRCPHARARLWRISSGYR